MNILLTGASGTVGFETLQKLLEKENTHISVFDLDTKNNRKKFSTFADKIDIFYGDISDAQQIEKACENVDLTIHLAAIIPPLADEKPEFAQKINVQGTQNIINALKKHSPNSMIIYSSSISIYGDRIENPWINVGDELIASVGDEYAKTKIQAEQIIQQSGLNWSIFRLSAIFGIKNHKIDKLMFHMPLNTPIEICTAEDTGRAFANAIFHQQEIKGKIFNLGGGENCRIFYKDFLEKNFKMYGLGKLNFPENSFATKNFHCAYYEDGDDLEKILHFRKDDIKSFFEKIEKKINPFTKFLTGICCPIIKIILASKSEPNIAKKKKQKDLEMRFFGV